MSPTPTELMNQRLTHVEREQAAAGARDATHTARIDALSARVDEGFHTTRTDIRDLRGLVIRLVWIVGGLYALLRWGPTVAQDMENAFTPPSSPAPIVRTLEADPSPRPSLVDARPSLDGGWQVATDGTVSPSVDCRRVKVDGTPCGFHEFVRLEGWIP